jgi:hypothetical protein
MVTCAIALGMWASTLSRETVKAAAAMGSIALFVLLAMGLGRSAGEQVALRSEWFVRLVAGLNVSPRIRAAALGDGPLFVLATAICGVALWQSQRAYRHAFITRASVSRMSLTLLAVAFVTAAALFAFGTALARVR